MGRLVVVTGTGTELGKTHLAVALVLAARERGLRVTGYKPVESGLSAPSTGDAFDLRSASTDPLDPSPRYAFVDPVSPHLAAEREGVAIDLEAIVELLRPARAAADLVVVELAGGLFSPLGPDVDNATLVGALAPDATVLVCRDALGVLHDVRSVVFASPARGLPRMHLAMIAPATPDASTGHNLGVVARSFGSSHRIPRGDRVELARGPAVAGLLDAVLIK